MELSDWTDQGRVSGGESGQSYEIDIDALSDLGGKYLFSAAYIQNAREQGLNLLREEPFETEDSYYRIFVYEVAANAEQVKNDEIY